MTGASAILNGMSSGTLGQDTLAPVEVYAAREPTGRNPRWWWVGLTACVAVAALLRIWGAPGTAGNGNLYYTAAVLSMSQDWTAFFTGALDTAGFAAMDKPAVWLWPSALLVKIFGLNWATLFLPNAIAGTATVLALALAVREAFGDGLPARLTALAAALGLAVSPINVAIDRNNSPDAIMLLALVLAAWMAIRAVRRGRLGPLIGAAALVGLAFNAKFFQAYLVVPGFALMWLVSGAGGLARRLGGLLAAGAALAAVSLAWPLMMATLVTDPPWISSSSDGSVQGRLVDIGSVHFSESPAATDPMIQTILGSLHTGEAFYAGPPGLDRLFTGALADQVSWWLPLAVVAVVALAFRLRQRRRDDPAVAATMLFAVWALACWAVFSLMSGTLHPYYTSMMVPALSALCAGGILAAWSAWGEGDRRGAWLFAAQALAVTVWTTVVLYTTTAQTPSALPGIVLVTGVAAVGAALVGARREPTGSLVALAALMAPLTWSVLTTSQPLVAFNPLGNQPGREGLTVVPKPMSDAFVMTMNPPVDPRMIDFLERNQGTAKWIMAAPSAISATPITVASGGAPVMTMGGYYGTDPNPTVPAFHEMVRAGEIRFLLAPPPGSSFVSGTAVDITNWALGNCRPVDPVTGAPAPLPPMPPQGPGGQPGAPGGPPAQMPMPILLDCAGAA